MPNEHKKYTEEMIKMLETMLAFENSQLEFSHEAIQMIDDLMKKTYRSAWTIGFEESSLFRKKRF